MTPDSPPLPQEPCPECEYLGEARVRIAALEAELGNAAAILVSAMKTLGVLRYPSQGLVAVEGWVWR